MNWLPVRSLRWHQMMCFSDTSLRGGTTWSQIGPTRFGQRRWNGQPWAGVLSSTTSFADNLGIKSGSGSSTAPSRTSV